MKKTFLISIFALTFILSACSQQSPNDNRNDNNKVPQLEEKVVIDSAKQELKKTNEKDLIQEINDKENKIEKSSEDNNLLEESDNIVINFLNLEEYPVGHKVYIRGESTDSYIRIQNYQCEDDHCNLGENGFWIEISNRNNFYKENNNFIPEEEFDEYKGVFVFGDNEFYNGLGYGPYTANTYILKINPNIQIRFYANSNDELISMILESISLEAE